MPIVQRRGSLSEQGELSMPPYGRRSSRGGGGSRGRTIALLILLLAIVGAAVFFPSIVAFFAGSSVDDAVAGDPRLIDTDAAAISRSLMQPPDVEPPGSASVLVSYSYFEKDAIQRENAEVFLTLGMGLDNRLWQPHAGTHFVIVVNGKVCRPCSRIYPLVQELDDPLLPQLSHAFVGTNVTLLRRIENEGMDFAAHNITVTWLQARALLRRYRYFIFLNSSVRGPFLPGYMPQNWQWTRAYTDRLVGNVRAVSSSLVCLPEVDLGGYGPKLESWAFGVDQAGLAALINETVFALRTCKLCGDGVVVHGEYGLTASMVRAGYRIDTLMAKYRGVDWSDPRHWRCNNNVHPSRHGTYDGISMHPFETIFIKASWHVGEPFTQKYTEWALAQAAGRDTTGGSFDERMYRYAVSPEAQESHHVEQCYQVLPLPYT